MSKPIIKVENLWKKYGNFEAVKGISFDVNEDEIFGFLGPNGAGKTTTLEIIETLRDKTSGKVSVGSYDLDTQADKIKGIIGVQLQSAGFHSGANLIEILQLFASLYGVKIKPMEVLDRFDLRDKAKEQYSKLSGGQKQRFSIATSLIHHPEIIFLDEPSTGLDPQARRNLWLTIKSIRDEGITVVLTTHFMDEAQFLCDRVAIIDNGKLLTIDTPLKLINSLLARGFKKEEQQLGASLEDVFLDLTGKTLRE